ncbi:hypothetical protein CDAR_413531 [Caerostris darwini]|uniref:Secreted protein n=1 Tax=Caerostris darwini TaxID=1538125 RepID=A0AAV4SZD8_9ARAC|nr:hypothetical protein CDAR_413531 [Caerostris darwini]
MSEWSHASLPWKNQSLWCVQISGVALLCVVLSSGLGEHRSACVRNLNAAFVHQCGDLTRCLRPRTVNCHCAKIFSLCFIIPNIQWMIDLYLAKYV